MAKTKDVIFGNRDKKTKFPIATIFIILCIILQLSQMIANVVVSIIQLSHYGTMESVLITNIAVTVGMTLFIILIEALICVFLFIRIRGVALIIAEASFILYYFTSVITSTIMYSFHGYDIAMVIGHAIGSLFDIIIPTLIIAGTIVLLIMDIKKPRPQQSAFKIVGIITVVAVGISLIISLISTVINIISPILIGSYVNIISIILQLLLLFIAILTAAYQALLAIWLINPYKQDDSAAQNAEASSDVVAINTDAEASPLSNEAQDAAPESETSGDAGNEPVCDASAENVTAEN